MGLQREDVYKHFKFTPRTAVISIVGLFVFPASVYWVAANTDVRSAKPRNTRVLAHLNDTATVEMGGNKEGTTVCCQILRTRAGSRVN